MTHFSAFAGHETTTTHSHRLRSTMRARHWLRILFALFALLICTGPSNAQSGRGTMDGYVVLRPAGRAIADGFLNEELRTSENPDARQRAHVELLGTRPSERVAYKVDTDERGLFHVARVLAGEYRLKISAAGFTPYETTLYIPSDFQGNLAVILKPAAGNKGRSDKQPSTGE